MKLTWLIRIMTIIGLLCTHAFAQDVTSMSIDARLEAIKSPTIIQDGTGVFSQNNRQGFVSIDEWNKNEDIQKYISNNYRDVLLNTSIDHQVLPGALPSINDKNILNEDHDSLLLCRNTARDYADCKSKNGIEACIKLGSKFGIACMDKPTNNKFGWGSNKDYFDASRITAMSAIITTKIPVCSGLLLSGKESESSTRLATAHHCLRHLKTCWNDSTCKPKAYRLSDYRGVNIKKEYEEYDDIDLMILDLDETLEVEEIPFNMEPLKQNMLVPAVIVGAGRVSYLNTDDVSNLEETVMATAMFSPRFTHCRIVCEQTMQILHACQTVDTTSGAPIFIGSGDMLKIASIHIGAQSGGSCGSSAQRSVSAWVLESYLN